jgi:excisionase family DNA binding protein
MTRTPENDDELMTRTEAAKYLALQPQTLAAWACKGRNVIPFIKHGKYVRYRRSDLEAFLADHTVGKDPE